MSVKELQFINISDGIFVNPSGIVTDFKLVHPLYIPYPQVFKLDGMEMVSKLVQ